MKPARFLLSGVAVAALLAAPLAAAAPSRPVKPVPAGPTKPTEAAPATEAAPVAATPTPAPAARPLTEGVAAVVNDEIISTYDLRQRTRLLIVSTGVQPTEQNLPQIEREALRALIDERLQMQEITRVQEKQKYKLLPTPKELDEEIDDLAKQYGTTGANLVKSMQQAGIEPATLRSQVSAQLAWRHYIGGRFRENVHVGDEQVAATLARMNAAAAKPQYLVSEVFLDAARVGGQQQAEDGAKQLLEQLRLGASFAAVARQFSALPTAANGGDSGWLVSGQMPPAIEHAVENLRAGQFSEPIPTQEGVYIVQLRDKRAGAGAKMVKLTQAAIRLPADAKPDDIATATAKLAALRESAHSCEALSTEAGKTPGVAAGDLGEANIDDLSPEFRNAVNGLKPGEISAPLRTATGLHLIGLCSRHVGGAAEPTRADVENRIYSDQLGAIARRFLRDLRNSATIESR